MSKRSKLLDRLLSIPADFTWDELVTVLAFYGFYELSKGKTGGSRRKFRDKEGNLMLLHEPHPSTVVKKYALRQVVANLKEKGKIKDE